MQSKLWPDAPRAFVRVLPSERWDLHSGAVIGWIIRAALKQGRSVLVQRRPGERTVRYDPRPS
jgi:hypothetical protein